MAVSPGKGHQVVNVQVCGTGECPVGVGVSPSAMAYIAATVALEFDRHLTGLDEDFRPGILAVSIAVNPVGPFATVVKRREARLWIRLYFGQVHLPLRRGAG